MNKLSHGLNHNNSNQFKHQEAAYHEGKYDDKIQEIVKRIEAKKKCGGTTILFGDMYIEEYLINLFSSYGYVFEMSKNPSTGILDLLVINLTKSNDKSNLDTESRVKIPSASLIKALAYERLESTSADVINEVQRRIKTAKQNNQHEVLLGDIHINDYVRDIFQNNGYVFEFSINPSSGVRNLLIINLAKSCKN